MPVVHPYKVVVGEMQGRNVEIQNSIKRLSVEFTTDLTSEVKFTVLDPGFEMHSAGYFVIRRLVYYGDSIFEVSEVSISRPASKEETVEVFCRNSAIQKMKRDKGAANFGKISPTAFAQQMAAKFGLTFFGESSAAKQAIVRTFDENSEESTWDVLSRLGSAEDFLVFESGGMLYFASEEFIIGKQTSFTLKYGADEKDPFYMFDFDLSRTDDLPVGQELRASIARENGVKIRAGMVVQIENLPYFDKKMVVTKVSWEAPAVDAGLGDSVPNPVSITARTPEDSDDLGAEKKVVKRGDRGAEVVRVQQAVGATADGIFGPLTEAAVIRFQIANNLDPSGSVGSATWAIIEGVV